MNKTTLYLAAAVPDDDSPTQSLAGVDTAPPPAPALHPQQRKVKGTLSPAERHVWFHAEKALPIPGK